MPVLNVIHAGSVAENCLVRNEWICPEYVTTRSTQIVDALVQHVSIFSVTMVISVVLSVPLALLARRAAWLKGLVLGASTLVYTVPSLALFSLLLPFTGLSAVTVVIGLVLYSLTVLVRSLVAGLEGVPPAVVDAARGVGYGPGRLLWQVEMPLAVPTAFAGLRVAAVSTVALTTIGFLLGFGGLGNLIKRGLDTNLRPEVLTGAVLCVLLAVLVDLLLVLLRRVATPWRTGVAA